MKKTPLFLLFILLFSTAAMAQPPKANAKKGARFGEKIDASGALPADTLSQLLVANAPADVKIKGKVVDVCTARGCFFYIKTAAGKIYIKTKDDAFFVPLALNGKTVVVKGRADIDRKNNEISIQATGVLVM